MTPEELEKLGDFYKNQRDLDPEFSIIIDENLWDLVDSESPYCPLCDACGEEGCCSPMSCQQHPDGSYCEAYLKDLKFGYMMNRFFQNEIAEHLPEELKAKYNAKWEEVYDEIYRNEQQ